MPQYTPATFTEDVAIDTNTIWAQFEAIAAAHNTHDSGDFGANDVARDAVITNKSLFSIPLAKNLTISGAAASGTVQAYALVPFDCFLVRAACIATTVAAGGDMQAAIYKEASTDVKLFTNVAMAASATPYDAGSPLVAEMTSQDVVSLRVSWAGSQSCSGLTISLWAKAHHQESTES